MLYLAFMVASIVALTAGIMVVVERNPVVSALDLAVCLISVGAIYLLMDAYMLAAIQVFVYAGAVVVLFLFVIMLLSLGLEEKAKIRLRLPLYLAPVAGGGLFALISRALLGSGPYFALDPLPAEVAAERPQAVGRALLITYLYPFEVISVLLLVSMVGALVLSRRKLA